MLNDSQLSQWATFHRYPHRPHWTDGAALCARTQPRHPPHRWKKYFVAFPVLNCGREMGLLRPQVLQR
jgi:hypothetical protein